MKCNTVRTKLAGYLDDAMTGGARVEERVLIRPRGVQRLSRRIGKIPQAQRYAFARTQERSAR